MAHDSECRSIALDRDADAPRAARRALIEWFPDLPVQTRENARVAVTELVTNAVRFGRAPVHLRASRRADVLVVEVRDEGDGRPRRRIPAEDGGIGLNLVYLLADRVEIERDRPRQMRVRHDCQPCHAGGPCDLRNRADPRRDHAPDRASRDIDLTARPEFDRLFAELDRSLPDRVVVDLREVTFFDTTGLHLAHRMDRWGRDNNVPVVFTRAIPAVMVALRSAGLKLRLTFSDAPEDQLGPRD